MHKGLIWSSLNPKTDWFIRRITKVKKKLVLIKLTVAMVIKMAVKIGLK